MFCVFKRIFRRDWCLSFQNIKKQLNNDKKLIKEYYENNFSLKFKNQELNKKIEEQQDTIDTLEEENFNLKSIISSLKKKFDKIKQLFHDKLFDWGKKNPIYNEVTEDFINKGILDDTDIKSIEKDDYER